eukprot:TRINITY_DN5249_c0_g1_i1.p1 TRINITY_DN5249_c0_g1~~TRINITY_DN5249_c0_g1_i1.p1  ORF type:complete len:598 (+),score=109.83 TRINITY_DN5249_c0_g1_i1:113-1906(+)
MHSVMGSALLEASPKQLVATGCFMGLISHAHAQTVTLTTITTTVPYFQYFSGYWSACSQTCGRGTRSREVYCQRTCSTYICPRADERECSVYVRPTASEDCFGPPCPEATTVTVTVPPTSTLVTSTVTTTRPVATGSCVPIFGGDRSSCLPQAEAALRCRAGCPCCQMQQDNSGSSGTTAIVPSDSSGGGSVADDPGPQSTTASTADGSTTVIIIAVASSCAVIALVLALLWWRSCIVRAEKSRALREKYAKEKVRDAAAQEAKEKTRTTSFRTKRPPTTNAEDGTIFDREFGAGVPSAPPEGYEFNEHFDEEEGRAGDASSERHRREEPSPTNRSKFKANGDKHWRSSEQPDVATSNARARANKPNDRQRRADKSEDSDECLTPPSGSPRSKQPETGSSTLPPGFAAASRAQRRTGKDSFDPSSFAETQEPPPQMPGQANSESDETPKGNANNPRRGMATPPRANEAPPRDDGQNKPKRPAPGAEGGGSSGGAQPGASAGAQSGASSAGGGGRNNREEDDDPRVAKETAASAAAADLIAKVDHELDEALNKDLETRRKIIKALILQWHPDKNQEEERATEVFRHLMARRPRYLQEA